MVSNQAHWVKQSKMDAIDDAISNEFNILDQKLEMEELIECDMTGNSTVNGIEAGRIAEGDSGGDVGGGAPGCSIPGIESTSPVTGLEINLYKSYVNVFNEYSKQPDQKTQIRHDCMWSGVCADQSHPEKSSIGCGGCKRHNPLLQQRQQQQQQQQQSTVDAFVGSLPEPSKSLQKIIPSEEPPPALGEMGGTPFAAASNLTMPVAAAHLKSAMKNVRTSFKAAQSSVQIPAGRSLLIKSQVSSNMPNQSGSKQLPLSPPASSESSSSASEGGCGAGCNPHVQVLRVPNLPHGSFLAACEQEARSKAAQNHARPDTPLSLDDDPLEFKHNLDLVATCTIGSNQQSLLHTGASPVSSAATTGAGNNGNTSCTTASPSNRATTTNHSSATTSGAESRTTASSSALYGRLGESCSCSSGGGSSINFSSTAFDSCHTPQYYYNYLQDTSNMEDMRNKQQLRQQLMMLDDYHQEPHLLPCSLDSQLEQLLSDLREIECSSETRSFLLDEPHTTTLPAAAGGTVAKDHRQSLLLPQQQFQYQGQQRTQSSLAPCGGGLSGGAPHISCSSSLELSHHLASPGNERKRRHHHHQFTHRRRGITARGWLSDDDEDEEDDLLEEDENDAEKQEQGAQLVGGLNSAHLINAWEEDDEEEEEEEEDEEEEDDEESDEDGERKGDQEVDEEEEEDVEEDEEEEDTQDGSMYGESSRSRSRTRSFRHRYHNQYSHHQHRRAARATYRTYDDNNGKVPKLPTTNLLANGAISTIIAGSGASLKTAMLGSKPNTTSNGSLSNAGANSTAAALAQQPAGGTASNAYQATHFGDHSYTRPKGVYNMNELGVQTPSDSDEEIDVVSVGDKNLPTNPTERDYRHLQSEVASKIRTASSRGTANGSLPYSSSSHHHHYQRQHQLADGPRQGLNHLGGIYPTPAGSTTISGANTPLPTRSGGASAASSPPPACTTSTTTSSTSSRKRAVGSGSSKRSSNSSKRMRLGHSKRGDGNGGRYDSCALAEELDTVEKRNLHNNLERQRRIGLKNLFEELKRQIPQLRDKDRAPKVNILREAAALCTRLNQEAEQANELRQQQIKLYERVRYLRASMHSHRLSVD